MEELCFLCCEEPDGSSFTDFEGGRVLKQLQKLLFHEETPTSRGNVYVVLETLKEKLSICETCASSISSAESIWKTAAEVELEVRNLQLELLQKLGQVQKHMNDFKCEMGRIQNVIQSSNESRLEALYAKEVTGRVLPRPGLMKALTEMSLIRRNIVAEITKVQTFSDQLDSKFSNHTNTSHTMELKSAMQPKEKEAGKLRSNTILMIGRGHQTSRPSPLVLLEPEPSTEAENMEDDNLSMSDIKIETDVNSIYDDYGDINNSNFMDSNSPESVHELVDGGKSECYDKEETFVPQDEMEEEFTPVVKSTRVLRSRSIALGTHDRHHQELNSISSAEDRKLRISKRVEGLSPWKKMVIGRILNALELKREGEIVGNQCSAEAEQGQDSDADNHPERNLKTVYDSEHDTLTFGDISIVLNEFEKRLYCSQCKFTHSKFNKMKKHIKEKHLGIFKCTKCFATFHTYKVHHDHMKSHDTDNGELLCDVCGRPMYSKGSLTVHRWTHKSAEEVAAALREGKKDPRNCGKGTFQCSGCGKIFGRKQKLLEHMKNNCVNSERVICPKCGKSFTKDYFTFRHEKLVCIPDESMLRYECHLCPSLFKEQKLLNLHKNRVHYAEIKSDLKHFTCPQCQATAKTAGDLTKHMQIHSTVRQYICDKGCGASFKQRNTCRKHEGKCDGSGTLITRGAKFARKLEMVENDDWDDTQFDEESNVVID